MKILIVYYSKTGITKKLAEKLSVVLKADIESIIDKKKRSGLIGRLTSGRDGMLKVPTEIGPVSKKSENYDVVLVGGPLWGFKSVAPAARTYLLQNRELIKKVGFFITFGNTSCTEAFDDLQSVYGKNVLGTLAIRQRDIDSAATEEEVKKFAEMVKKSAD